jgi:succinate-semialdehyde dehydrogenase/glutarate-semialdehyde dehydrogenase
VATAAAVAAGAFLNTGQICTSMERIYVHRAIAQPFLDALVAEARTYRIGDGRDESTRLGPLVDERQRGIVVDHVGEAVRRGATVLVGGEVPDGPGFFYPATVVTDVPDDTPLMTEETFGAVAPVRVVDSFDEALALATDSSFGITGRRAAFDAATRQATVITAPR